SRFLLRPILRQVWLQSNRLSIFLAIHHFFDLVVRLPTLQIQRSCAEFLIFVFISPLQMQIPALDQRPHRRKQKTQPSRFRRSFLTPHPHPPTPPPIRPRIKRHAPQADAAHIRPPQFRSHLRRLSPKGQLRRCRHCSLQHLHPPRQCPRLSIDHRLHSAL